jgi:hypothetical protein
VLCAIEAIITLIDLPFSGECNGQRRTDRRRNLRRRFFGQNRTEREAGSRAYCCDVEANSPPAAVRHW